MDDYKNQKLSEFLELYDTTTLPIEEIFKRIDVCRSNSTARYIRGSLRKMIVDPNNTKYKTYKERFKES